MAKFWRTLITVLILSCALWSYCRFFAAGFEPVTIVRNDMENGPLDWEYKIQYLQELFKPGDWELEQPKILEINDFKILLDDYQMLNATQVSVNRCTIIIVNKDQSLTERERTARATVVRCPDGATLQFEKPLLQGSFGKNNRIIGGQLLGQVQAFSRGVLEGPEDDFLLTTRDVHVTADMISTLANVEFRYGRSEGKGRNVSIQLINQKLIGAPMGSGVDEFNQSSQKIVVDRISIQSLERLYLVMPSKKNNKTAAGSSAGTVTGSGNDPATGKLVNFDMDVPIEIRCRGEVVYNALLKTATLSGNVSLLRLVQNNDPDTLLCETLNLLFRPRAELEETDSKSQAGSSSKPGTAFFGASSGSEAPKIVQKDDFANDWDLKFVRMEALGRTVTLRSPAQKFSLQCNQLMYDQTKGALEMESTTDMGVVSWDVHEMHVKNLVYYQAAGNPFGRIQCNCGGWVKSITDEKGSYVRAFWNERMSVAPDEEDPSELLVCLGAQSRLEFCPDKGEKSTLGADNIYFWLTPQKKAPVPDVTGPGASAQWPPQGVSDQYASAPLLRGQSAASDVVAPRTIVNEKKNSGRLSLMPSRALAQSSVAITMPQAKAHFDKVQLWFTQTEESAQYRDMQNGEKSTEDLPANNILSLSDQSAEDATGGQIFDISGKLLQGKFLVNGSKIHVSEVVLEDNVVVQEIPQESSKTAASEIGASPEAASSELSATPVSANPANKALKGLYLAGTRVELFNPLDSNASVSLIGAPAALRTESLDISSNGINFDRANNRIWINGAGMATIEGATLKITGSQGNSPLTSFFDTSNRTNAAGVAQANSSSESAPGVQSGPAQPIQINWENSMTFNGDRLLFDGSVKIETKELKTLPTGIAQIQKTTATCSQLEITFNRHVDLLHAQQGDKIEAHEVMLSNNLVIRNECYENGKQVSLDCMNAQKLTYYVQAEMIHAFGPGQLTTWRYMNNGGFNLLSSLSTPHRSAENASFRNSALNNRYYVGYPPYSNETSGNRIDHDKPSDNRLASEGGNPYAEYGVINRGGGKTAPFQTERLANNRNTDSSEPQPQPNGSTTGTNPPSSKSDAPSLVYFNLKFLQLMKGSLTYRTFEFSTRVSAIYGPVAQINDTLSPARISALPPDAVVLSCNQLSLSIKQPSTATTISRMQNSSLETSESNSMTGQSEVRSGAALVDMIAQKNVKVETTFFNAVANQLTWSGERGLMVIEGNGKTNAEFHVQKVVGGAMQTASGSKIYYWPQQRRVQVEGMQDMSIDNMINLGI